MDAIGDMLTSIRNGYMSRKESVIVPHSKLKLSVANKLADLSFVEKVSVEGEGAVKNLNIQLKYTGGSPALSRLKRISKPGLRIYSPKKSLKPVLRGLGYVLLSTPKGILTNKEAVKEGIGGEVICEVW